jgi:NTP pyrophosphatase (non-canonical NTP hydrolase)
MDLNKHAEGVMRTVKILKQPEMNQVHMLLGMFGEIGELTDIFKRYLIYNEPIDWVHVQEEVGDLLYYIFAFCTINGFNLEKILEQNLAKLKVRYPEKYTDELAKKRDLEKERQILRELGYREEK